jgi:putative phage-type endonuclease
MKILELQQGSPEWHAHRMQHYNASDASAMMGASKYKTRNELLKEYATGIRPEVDANTQRLFDKGHAAEAAARQIAEGIVGEDLYPVTGTLVVEEMKLSASFDGLTMDESVNWEHKMLNKDLRNMLDTGLDMHYQWQLAHQMLVSGAEKSLFMASDENEHIEMWVFRDEELIDRLIAGWKQFSDDLDNYAPSEVKEMPKAEVTIDLPALFVHARGEITTHNMDEFGTALAANLAETRAIVLVTDQDFSNAKAAAKKFRDTAKAIAISKEQMLAQTETIGEAARKMDAWAKDLDATALQLEKDVEREDKAKKEAMVIAGKNAYMEHVAALEARVSPIRLNLSMPNFADAIKGKRNYTSMQDAIDTELANAKIAANEVADRIDANLKHFHIVAWDSKTLFPDLQNIASKQPDDFAAVVKMRIQEHAAAEQAKAEALRERIRAEEQAKAEAKVRAETAAREAQERAEANRLAAIETQQVTPEITQVEQAPAPVREPAPMVHSVTLERPIVEPVKAQEPIRPSADYLIGVIAREFDVSRRQSRDWLATTNFNESEVA